MADWPLIAIRWALYADLGLLFGLLLFTLYALAGDERERLLRLRRWTLALAALGILLSAFGFLQSAAAMLGTGIEGVDRVSAMMLLMETSVGWALLARLAALIILCIAALTPVLRRVVGLMLLTLLAAIAVASLAWSGHGAATEGPAGMVHLVSDIIHLLAAAAWIGALGAFILFVSRRPQTLETVNAAHRALANFATVGAIIVGLIVATGLVNSYLLVGPRNVLRLAESDYGRLLLIKLTLFAIMLGLAAGNRFRLTPALGKAIGRDGTAATVAPLKRSLWIETCIGILILGLVAWLGTLPPPASGGP
ncbi:copper homeostasis membrane protein CopD [Sphingobium yanoikuyae]|uniref:Copper homeostasis membrane protein CopD n=1 Tax=Sphingobium yanoikuyae TaxID=13690 RepID=A0AA42X3B8_SPHYA|nr:copper homeostasis membrane protein CopD [Sphingobium yanoikuyae]MDH2135142.1 copper homeostasis membrane protein CopD [Sphingobium yanoikuyae]MDH2151245.1 copper homeostasis membrane protein CopD [Sphingobium yanoikuyae]MDH2169464.1 copper homeostasis membrane protein CopD [Sphingobium yanoikuyae]